MNTDNSPQNGSQKTLTFGVVLSGCGVQDGSEIHEATLLLLALDREGIRARIFAPDMEQAFVASHLTGKVLAGEHRSVLEESARIARGRIEPLTNVNSAELDALVFPGGFGAAVNLSDFGSAGSAMRVRGDVESAILGMHGAGKPTGYICIAPVLAARVLGKFQPELTIGNDAGTAGALRKMGARHVEAPADGIVIDRQNRIVSTPAYMLARRISQVADGIESLVRALREMALEPRK